LSSLTRENLAMLDAAESLGGDADLGDLRTALANAQQAAATAAAAPKLPPLKMTRPPRPKYPASAKGVEGWVRNHNEGHAVTRR
jgi:hypothetical protein